MINRIKGLFLIGLFIIGILAVGVPAQASFTLGDLTGTNPYHTNDFDPHVPGVIGYVWPGSGECAYLGFPNQANTNGCGPGYQAPYPSGNPPGAPSNSWYQLEGDTYAPFGAVLTGTTGDLIFALNATAWSTAACQASDGTNSAGVFDDAGGLGVDAMRLAQSPPCTRFGGRWEGVDILIPPGFAVPGSPQVVSTITNDYSSIAVARISSNDRYAPGWTLVEVLADAGFDSANPSTATTPYYNHQGIDFSTAGEWYYVRVNGVLAPSVAGRYFFKILLLGGTPSICGEEGTGTGTGALPSFTFAGTTNTAELLCQFPFLLLRRLMGCRLGVGF